MRHLKPDLETLRELAAGNDRNDRSGCRQSACYNAVPVYMTLPAHTRKALELFSILKTQSKHCFMLESREDEAGWGRYTFLGFDPSLGLSCKDGVITIEAGTSFVPENTDPEVLIRSILADYKSPRLPELPPFTGGLVGYFAYDYITYVEPTLVLDATDTEGFMDIDLMLFDTVIAYDRLKGLIYLIKTIRTDALEENYHKAAFELASLAELICTAKACITPPLKLESSFEPVFNEERYSVMVEKAKHYIHEGDIFQVVLSNRLSAQAQGSLLDAYRILAKRNPSPYLFYFASAHIELVGASPETLVKLTGTTAYTFPLAGTRARGATPAEDQALAQDLLQDEKECAEHNMLVDLGRNDLGKVSEFGSVVLEDYKNIERFSHVMHMGSTVRSTLQEGKDALDLIRAVLPAGTLSGAPKLRACEIINELEGDRRGIYGGAVGYLGFNGDMDTCIAIRLAFMKEGRIFVRSGAGIVADSVPNLEYQECCNKMQAVLDALHAAAEGEATHEAGQKGASL